MKEKILAKLVEKYKGLPKRFLETWAVKLTTKVTDETQIEDTVNGLDNMPMTMQELAQEFQREGDRRVSEVRKPTQSQQQQQQDQLNDDSGFGEDAPEWFKKTMTPLMQKIVSLEQDRTKETITSTIKSKLKDVPEVFWSKRVLPTKSEDVETFITEINTDWGALTQDSTNSGLLIKKPETQTAAQTSKKIDDEILAYTKETNDLLEASKQN